jgi:hypothetical protein
METASVMMLGVWPYLSCHPSSSDPQDIWLTHEHPSESQSALKRRHVTKEKANSLYAVCL